MAFFVNFSKISDLIVSGKLKAIEFFATKLLVMIIAVMEVEKLSFSDQRIRKAISLHLLN